MGHIAHLRNNLNQKAHLRKATIKLIKRKNIYLLFKNCMVLICKTSSSIVKIGPMGLEKKIFKFRQCSFMPPLKKGAHCFATVGRSVGCPLNIYLPLHLINTKFGGVALNE